MKSRMRALMARSLVLAVLISLPHTGVAQDAAAAAGPAASAMPGPAGEGRRPGGGAPGYLGASGLDILAILPPPPLKGDPRFDAERRVFRSTRKLEGTPRWELASQDAAISPTDMLRAFSCAVGVELTPERAPKLVQVLQKAMRDAGRAVGVAKDHFAKPRPFLVDRGSTCRPPAEIGTSTDYPSGHSVAGWTWALVLAEVAPDRASPILARGRAYGDSRIVCGMHTPSAVEAGWLSGSAVMARVAAEPAYRADVETARQELKALRRDGPVPDAARCEKETTLIAMPIHEGRIQ